MSYLSISVKEAMNHINSSVNGWFLPAIQRPYVWGSRYENEMYICKLFDSILRGYPIGSLIIWNTEEKVPYREFITNYSHTGEGAKLVDQGLYGRADKFLIYDGQQRLQTLYSCLRYTFNSRVLAFDLLYDKNLSSDQDETGFCFVDRNTPLSWHTLRLNELFIKQPNDETRFEDEIVKKSGSISEEEKYILKNNLRSLWKVFVETDKKSLAYFLIKTDDEKEVNEIFERLNTGGIPLSLSDLLFSDIKEQFPGFEEQLQSASKNIYHSTAKGFSFTAYNILQLLNLAVKNQVRVDPKKVKKSEINLFHEVWITMEKPLEAFFSDFIWGQFKINNGSIIPRKTALLPIVIYLHEIYKKGFQFNKDISKLNLEIIKRYFIKSQVNGWDLQSMIDNFTRIILNESHNSSSRMFDFPLGKIEAYINSQRKRSTEVFEESFINYTWFALKILTPNRIYQFEPDMKGRFNPEIDHVFPRKLVGRNKEYEEQVDVVWNMQPTKGDINSYKTNYHPKLFFTDKAINKSGEAILGSKFIHEYDFLFPVATDYSIDFSDDIWERPIDFIKQRRQKMIEFLHNNYGLTLLESGSAAVERFNGSSTELSGSNQ